MAEVVRWNADSLDVLTAVAYVMTIGGKSDRSLRAELKKAIGAHTKLAGRRLVKNTGQREHFEVERSFAQLVDKMHWSSGATDLATKAAVDLMQLFPHRHRLSVACACSMFCCESLFKAAHAFATRSGEFGVQGLENAFTKAIEAAKYVDEIFTSSFNVQGQDASNYSRDYAIQNLQLAIKVGEDVYAKTYAELGDGKSEEASEQRVRFWYLLAKGLTPLRAKNAGLYLAVGYSTFMAGWVKALCRYSPFGPGGYNGNHIVVNGGSTGADNVKETGWRSGDLYDAIEGSSAKLDELRTYMYMKDIS